MATYCKFTVKTSTEVEFILAHKSVELSLQATSTNEIPKVRRNPTPSVPKGGPTFNEETSAPLQTRPVLL